MRRGRLFVIAAPSGAGKTSLVKALLTLKPQLQVSISHTTRPRRATEQHGREYFFVTIAQFQRLISERQFLEHAQVFDNFYGTGREAVQALLAQGQDVILEIDWQGARQVRERAPDSQTVFILPPSFDELERRLRERRTDSAAVIERRLKDARSDMTHWDEFDHVIVNDDFDAALDRLADVISGREQRARTSLPAVRGAAEAILGARPRP